MSGVAKGIGKVFKKVAKVVTKVAPYVLAAAAVVFTAGAAIPAVGAALGGATLSGTLGAGVTAVLGEGALSSIVTGALTKAAYGAAIGGITSKISGGKFSDGVKKGALAGAIIGGVGEAVSQAGLFGSSATTATGSTPGVAQTIQPESAYAPGAVQAQTLAPQGFLDQAASAPTPAVGGSLSSSVSSATSSSDPTGGLFSKGGWLERNGDLAGNVISGLGKGLLGSSEAEAAADAEREKAKVARENYAGAGGLLAYQPNIPGLTKFGQSRNFGGYVRDPGTGRYLWQS